VIYSSNNKEFQYKFCQYGSLDDYFLNIHNYWSNQLETSCSVKIDDCFNINNAYVFINFFVQNCHSFQDTVFSDYYSIFNLYRENGITVFEQMPRRYESLLTYGFSSNYKDILVSRDPSDIHHILIKEKQGLIENNKSRFEQGIARFVTIYILNGDTLNSPVASCGSFWGIKEDKANIKVAIFPNPNNGNFQVKNIENGIVEIYSLIGEKVYSEFIKDNFQESITIHLENKVEKGIYLIKITSCQKITTFKLLLE
jgi:hypothetical protein